MGHPSLVSGRAFQVDNVLIKSEGRRPKKKRTLSTRVAAQSRTVWTRMHPSLVARAVCMYVSGLVDWVAAEE